MMKATIQKRFSLYSTNNSEKSEGNRFSEVKMVVIFNKEIAPQSWECLLSITPRAWAYALQNQVRVLTPKGNQFTYTDHSAPITFVKQLYFPDSRCFPSNTCIVVSCDSSSSLHIWGYNEATGKLHVFCRHVLPSAAALGDYAIQVRVLYRDETLSLFILSSESGIQCLRFPQSTLQNETWVIDDIKSVLEFYKPSALGLLSQYVAVASPGVLGLWSLETSMTDCIGLHGTEGMEYNIKDIIPLNESMFLLRSVENLQVWDITSRTCNQRFSISSGNDLMRLVCMSPDKWLVVLCPHIQEKRTVRPILRVVGITCQENTFHFTGECNYYELMDPVVSIESVRVSDDEVDVYTMHSFYILRSRFKVSNFNQTEISSFSVLDRAVLERGLDTASRGNSIVGEKIEELHHILELHEQQLNAINEQVVKHSVLVQSIASNEKTSHEIIDIDNVITAIERRLTGLKNRIAQRESRDEEIVKKCIEESTSFLVQTLPGAIAELLRGNIGQGVDNALSKTLGEFGENLDDKIGQHVRNSVELILGKYTEFSEALLKKEADKVQVERNVLNDQISQQIRSVKDYIASTNPKTQKVNKEIFSETKLLLLLQEKKYAEAIALSCESRETLCLGLKIITSSLSDDFLSVIQPSDSLLKDMINILSDFSELSNESIADQVSWLQSISMSDIFLAKRDSLTQVRCTCSRRLCELQDAESWNNVMRHQIKLAIRMYN